jgi:hypothetical protein
MALWRAVWMIHARGNSGTPDAGHWSTAATKSPNSRIRAATNSAPVGAIDRIQGRGNILGHAPPGCRFGLSPFDSLMEDRMKYMLLIYDDEILCSR